MYLLNFPSFVFAIKTNQRISRAPGAKPGFARSGEVYDLLLIRVKDMLRVNAT